MKITIILIALLVLFYAGLQLTTLAGGPIKDRNLKYAQLMVIK